MNFFPWLKLTKIGTKKPTLLVGLNVGEIACQRRMIVIDYSYESGGFSYGRQD
jgi:hypothetical protein